MGSSRAQDSPAAPAPTDPVPLAVQALLDARAFAPLETTLPRAVLESPDPAIAARILLALLDAYPEHRDPAVAETLARFRASLAWLAVNPNPLDAVLTDAGHPVHMVIRGLIRRGAIADDPILLLRIAKVPAWHAACRERLAQRLTRAEQDALRRHAHLRLHPRRESIPLDKPTVVEPKLPTAARPDRDFRRAFRLGRDGVVRELRAALASPSPAAQARAIQLIRAANVAADCHAELVALSASPNARLAAAACTALRGVAFIRVRDPLTLAAQSHDGRIAASALESLAVSARRAGQFHLIRATLDEALANTHHRLRAAAARELIRTNDPTGLDALASMLADPRPAHRLAAIWLAERLRAGGRDITPALAALEAIAAHDRSSLLRRRASGILRAAGIPSRPARTLAIAHRG